MSGVGGPRAMGARSLLRRDGPVPEAGIDAATTPRIIVSPGEALASSTRPYDSPLLYALGWETADHRGHKFWTHSGGICMRWGRRFSSLLDLEFGVVTLGNTASSPNALESLSLGVPQG